MTANSSAETTGIRLELGEVTDGDGKPLDYEAIIFFAGVYDSPEIRVNAPNAQSIARQIVELWNSAPAQAQPGWPRIFNVKRSADNGWHGEISFARCPTDAELQALEIFLRDDHQPAPAPQFPERQP